MQTNAVGDFDIDNLDKLKDKYHSQLNEVKESKKKKVVYISLYGAKDLHCFEI